MWNNKKILSLFLFLLIFFAFDIFWEINFPKINILEIKSEKINSNLEIRIIQITDLHNQKFFNNQDLFKKIKNSNPDFIVITGDLIDKTTKDYSYAYDFVDNLLKINKNVYFVAGDHEQKNTRDIIQGLSEQGVQVLDRKKSSFQKENQQIDIYGLDYYNDEKDLAFLENISPDIYSILLLHNPYLAINNEKLNPELILSGDTHGGQVRIPFLGAPIIPGQPFFPKYSKGLYKLNNGSLLYIDSGLGNTFLPLRFANQSQISLIKILGK
jgi:hypothetical protein